MRAESHASYDLPRAGALRLGSTEFLRAHGVRLPYVAGAMVQGIASEALVIRMARARLLSFYGAGALPLSTVAEAITRIRAALPEDAPWGVNLLCNTQRPAVEDETVRLLIERGVRHIEASAFVQITPALAWYRLSGLRRGEGGRIVALHKVQAKLSRPEVAAHFFAPAAPKLVSKLLAEGRISPEQAELAKHVPMADDVCVEADSGGHTDKGVAFSLLPTMFALRDRAMREHRYETAVRIGAAGGIGTPSAAAAAFVMGAEFIVTGSINQCTVEAGTSDLVKDMLQGAGVQDTEMAPAGDMFEIGARVQVFRRGVFFPARANKLYELYRRHQRIEDVDGATRREIEDKFFKRSFEQVWSEIRERVGARSSEELAQLEQNPRARLARTFRWYFAKTGRAAIAGDAEDKLNFQIHCGPALGSCNEWLKGTAEEGWRARHVDSLGLLIMQGAVEHLKHQLRRMQAP